MILSDEGVKAAISGIAREINAQTAACLRERECPPPTLILLGEEGSRYLAAVERETKKMGIPTIRCTEVGESVMLLLQSIVADMKKKGHPYDAVWDIESPKLKEAFREFKTKDIDRLERDGTSSAANAVALILYTLDRCAEDHIAIIGRRHATKGLNRTLLAGDATTTQRHRKTRNLRRATYAASVIVNATRGPFPPDCSIRGKLVVDVNGNLERETAREKMKCEAYGEYPPQYIGPEEVGEITVAVLLNRAAREVD